MFVLGWMDRKGNVQQRFLDIIKRMVGTLKENKRYGYLLIRVVEAKISFKDYNPQLRHIRDSKLKK